MATIAELRQQVFAPGQKVPQSGIYSVIHDGVHRGEEHDVTAVFGEPFPPCNHCGHHPRFRLKVAAIHIKNHDHFK